MTMHWGVDSDDVVTKRFVEKVAAMSGQSPEFWGRYIGGNTEVGTPLGKSEAELIHTNGLSLLPIYNALRSHEPAGTAQNATGHAQSAAQSAQSLGIPNDGSVCIYADLENWVTSDAWIDGWRTAIEAAGYLAGFYGSVALPGFARGYTAAYTRAPEDFANVLLYVNQPSYYPTKTNVKAGYEKTFGGAVPPCNPSAGAIWQYVLSALNATIDIDTSTDVGFAAMWV